MAEKTYAILGLGGNVDNVIVADESFASAVYPHALCLEGFDPRPSVGWRYEAGGFVSLASGPIVRHPVQIPQYQFLKRFTTQELVAIFGYQNFSLTTEENNHMRVYILLIQAATTIDLADATIAEALAYFVTVGLLGSGRPAEILSGV